MYMSERIDAIYEGGVFRPAVPVSIPEGQRVSLDVSSASTLPDDLGDVADLLDEEYAAACRRQPNHAPSLEEVRRALSSIPGSLAEMIVAERDER
jgi:predicted DNA-binding antitoxin AbrB/MazE fold protein